MDDTDEKERQENLKMMKNPDTWGCWPILPMKKVEGHGPCLVGFLLATGKPKLYLRNFMDLTGMGIRTIKEVDDRIDAKEYESFEDILIEGWVVD